MCMYYLRGHLESSIVTVSSPSMALFIFFPFFSFPIHTMHLHHTPPHAGPYQWLHQISQATGTGISYETSNPYMACSSESTEGLCPHGKWDCSAENVAKTCSTFPPEGSCLGLNHYPNVTISNYGSISGQAAMQKEIMARGPISCGIDAMPILKYQGGVVTDPGSGVDHVISVVGWGKGNDSEGKGYVNVGCQTKWARTHTPTITYLYQTPRPSRVSLLATS